MSEAHRGVAVILLLVAALVVPMVGVAVSNGVEVDSGITLNAPNGPMVTFSDGATNANLTYPYQGSDTVVWEADNGNMTISATGNITATVDQIEGTQTTVSNIGSGAVLRIDPADKQAVEVTDEVDTIMFTDVVLDDGTSDIFVDGTGNANINVTSGLSSANYVEAVNSSGVVLGKAKVQNGAANFSIDLSSHTLSLQSSGSSSAPILDNPQPTGPQSNYPTTLQVDVDDDDFNGDTVTVDFNHNGQSVGSDTLNSPGTASTTISQPPRGQNRWNVTATDSFNNTVTANYTFATPENLTVRESLVDHDIIDDRQVNVTFYTSGGSIINKTTSNGNISMDGVPLENPIIVEVDAVNDSNLDPSKYYPVESNIIDLTQQTDIYLIPGNETVNNVRFKIDDNTGGEFSGNDAQVIVERPINQSSYSQFQWERYYGDTTGPAGTTAILENDQRYRVIVRNSDGDTRVLGSYTPIQDEQIVLQVGSISAGISDPETDWRWNASYISSTESVQFQFNDSQQDTSRIWLTVYERGNESNVILQNQSFAGPHGELKVTTSVPQQYNESTWIVDAVVVRNGNSYDIQQPVGPRSPAIPQLPSRLKIIISIGSILVVAGLFSQLNGYVGGLVVSGLGGLFWFVDFLPDETGVGVVVLAMIAAAIIFLRERARGQAP